MKRTFAPLLLSVFAFLSPAVTAQEAELPPLEEATMEEDPTFAAFKDVERYFRETESLKAGFVQHAPSGEITSGMVYMARPGRIRFDYAGDVPFLVVADGEALNLIDYEVGQVTRWPIDDTPLRLLLGRDVDLARLGAQVQAAPGGDERIVAVHARDENRPELGTITIFFERRAGEPDTLTLKGWLVKDAQAQETYVELVDAVLNPELEKKLWTFEDPRGLSKRRRTR